MTALGVLACAQEVIPKQDSSPLALKRGLGFQGSEGLSLCEAC